ncbi:MAG: hypothetical protein ACPIA2_14290 [Mariniblastus sp.]
MKAVRGKQTFLSAALAPEWPDERDQPEGQSEQIGIEPSAFESQVVAFVTIAVKTMKSFART